MWNIGEYVCFDGPHQNGGAQNRNISSKRPPGRSRQFFSLALRVNLALQAVLDVKSYLLDETSLSALLPNVEHWGIRMF